MILTATRLRRYRKGYDTPPRGRGNEARWYRRRLTARMVAHVRATLREAPFAPQIIPECP